MDSLTVDAWWSALGVIAAATVTVLPTMLLALVVLDEAVLTAWERLGLGLCLALVLPPALLFLEFQLAGLAFSRGLVVANAAGIALAAIALGGRRLRTAWRGASGATPATLLAIMLIAFALRFASASPTFYEFDPYFYTKVTERLVRDGVVATLSPEAWAPRGLFLRVPPLMHYCTAAWLAVYEAVAGGEPAKEALVRASQLMPPLTGALVAFLGSLLVRRRYGDRVGLAVAGLLTVMPQLVERFAAGRAEQQPYGLFTVLLAWALYALSLEAPSARLAVATAGAVAASVLGSQHHIVALAVLAAYAGAQAVVDYVRSAPDRRLVVATTSALIGAIGASAVYWAYAGGHRYRFLDAPQLALAVAFALVVVMHAAARALRTGRARLLGALGVAAVGAGALVATPLVAALGALLPGRGALVPSAVGLTILEEHAALIPFGATVAALPAAVVLLAVAAGVGILLRDPRDDGGRGPWGGRARWPWAIAAIGGPIAAVVLADTARRPLAAIGAHGAPLLREALTVRAGSRVWIYLLAAAAVVAIDQLVGARPGRVRLLLPFIVFPLAFPGLEQLKFAPHLGIALALAVGIVLGELGWTGDALRGSAWAARLRWPLRAATVAIALGAVAVVLASVVTLPRLMVALASSRISSEWVVLREATPTFEGEPASAMGWLHHHLNRLDPETQGRCRQRFGWDCRVLAWWDYGHWITFFGEANAVLDPTNQFHDYVHGVARALVDGTPALERAMRMHRATHVLVNAELIDRWSALTFLGGSCARGHSELCPAEPEIDWRVGRGRSRYEREHAYEYLTAVGPACRLSGRAGPAFVVRSTSGARYCADDTALRRLGADGRPDGAERPIVRVSTPILGAPSERDATYLVGTRRAGTFLNVNPDAGGTGLASRAFDAAFTRLFFFEDLPGFRLVFRSPGATVKIFEYVGAPASTAPDTGTALDLPAGRRP